MLFLLLVLGLAYGNAMSSITASAQVQPALGLTQHTVGVPSHAYSPIAGQSSVIVVAVEFQDLRHKRLLSEIQQSVFKDLAQYWKDVSYGKVTLTGDIVGWITATRPYSFYLASDSPETRLSLILDAVNQADNQVDFRKYRYVMVVHAGQDQAYTGSKNDLWTVASIGAVPVTTQEGSISVGVTLLAEFDPLGPYAHEMGHNFGLPDLWNYDILNSACKYCDNYVGEFDVMAHGFWANNGSTPVEPSVWSKVQLGWISDSQVLTAAKGMTNATLKRLDTPDGLKAVKFPLTDTTYYLVEVRHRVGWDRYLPDEGVVVYYVDTNRGSGDGPVRIRPSVDINRPAWRAGQTFMNLQDGVGVYVAGQNDDFSFRIDYAMGLAASSFTLTIKAPEQGLVVKVNENEYHTDTNGQLVLHESWGVHDVWIQDSIPISDTVRLAFVGWQDGATQNPRTVMLGGNVTLVAQYRMQYLLSVSSPFPVEGAGWHNANTTVSIAVKQPVIDHGNGTRHVFTGWTGDATGTGNVTSILMDGPKRITANWKQQFLLKVESSYGPPSGAGWYDVGSIVTVTVQPTVQIMLGERVVFTGWSGSISDASPNITMQLKSPMRISANWKTQHLVQIVVLDSHGMPASNPQPQVEFTNGASMLVSGEKIWLDSGSYTVTEVTWHGVAINSDGTQLVYETSPNAVWKIQANIFTVRVALKGILTGLSANGAVVTIRLPSGETFTATTSNGVAMFDQIPAGQYSAVLSAGFFTKPFQLDVRGDVDVSFAMLLPIELVAIAAVFVVIGGAFCIMRRKS
jgi:M6 family metalloprotease-like protein/uncharacterized repeat protein (TIGR02543 family)